MGNYTKYSKARIASQGVSSKLTDKPNAIITGPPIIKGTAIPRPITITDISASR